MADSTLIQTYSTLRRAIGAHLGYGRDPTAWSSDETTDVADILKSGLMQAYFPPPHQQGRRAHEWSFLKPLAQLTTVAPYTTGTITIVDGAVTGSGTVFPANATSRVLWVNGREYTVATRGGDTSLTLDDTTVDADAGTSYSLVQIDYDLPDNFGGQILDAMTYEPGEANSLAGGEVVIVNEQFMRMKLQTPGVTGYPRHAAVRPKAADPDTRSTRWQIRMWPVANAIMHFRYRYQAVPDTLDGTNLYHEGGVQFTELLLASCLAVAEDRLNDGQNPMWKQRFMERLQAMVANDAAVSSAQTLGSGWNCLHDSEEPVPYYGHYVVQAPS